jgi:hypothetical protein
MSALSPSKGGRPVFIPNFQSLIQQQETRLMNLRQILAALPTLAAALSLSGSAAAQHFDILLARPVAGTQTVIGGADVDELEFDDATRVFEGEMGDIGSEFAALEPGVDHPNLDNPVSAYPTSAAGLVPGDVLRLFERDFSVDGITDDLFYWNGLGPVAFVPASADFRIDGGDPLPGAAGAGGSYHDHPFLVVDSDALPGIYLASVFGVVDGFDPSDPAYVVFATGEEFEEAHELAAEYAYANLVVPEPASLWMLSVACATVVSARRRTRSAAGR